MPNYKGITTREIADIIENMSVIMAYILVKAL